MVDLVHLVGTHLPRLAAGRFPDLLWRIPTEERVLYLTFDDGPTATMTHALLDLLHRFEATASFFLIGRHAQQRPELVRALHAAGHTVGNHSFTHVNPRRAPEDTVIAELERTTGVLEDLVAQPLRWMRPPYGLFTEGLRRWCQLRRQRCTMWDVGPGDFLASATPRRVERRVRSAVRPGSIIALHDNPKAAAALLPALQTLLPVLQDQGWRFAAL